MNNYKSLLVWKSVSSFR